MRILVTGADGLLGSNLVRLLLREGYSVRTFIHHSSSSTTLDGLDLERVKGDILDPEAVREAVKGCDAVIHAAAMTNVWPARSEKVRKVNIEGTLNVIDAVLEHNTGRMIYIGSGSSVNTEKGGTGRYPFPGAKFGLDYIDSKHDALVAVMDAVAKRGLPALAILPTFMIGAYDTLPSSGQMILAVARGKLKAYTGGGRNFIYVNDVAAAVVNGLKNGEIGKFYVACNENLTYREFILKAASITGRRAPVMKAPGWLVKTAGLLGTISGKITGRQPLLTYQMARISCEKQFVTDNEAVTYLKMPRTDIETAIRECYDWFVENKYL